jgi:hypothetical protein
MESDKFKLNFISFAAFTKLLDWSILIQMS